MLSKNQIKWLGVLGSVASLVGLLIYFLPSEPTPQVSVSGAGSVGMAGVSAAGPITVNVNQMPSEPQMTVMLSHEQFWEAIERADVRVIDRLGAEGMKLKPEYLQLYFNEYFTAETFESLHKNSALPAAGCPIDRGGIGFYAAAAANPVKRKALRSVCGTIAVLSALGSLKTQVKSENDAAHELNRTFDSRVASCVAKLNRTSVNSWYDSASGFNVNGPLTYTLEQSVLAELVAGLVGGTIVDDNMALSLRQAISSSCIKYNAPPKPDERALKATAAALAMLGSE